MHGEEDCKYCDRSIRLAILFPVLLAIALIVGAFGVFIFLPLMFATAFLRETMEKQRAGELRTVRPHTELRERTWMDVFVPFLRILGLLRFFHFFILFIPQEQFHAFFSSLSRQSSPFSTSPRLQELPTPSF
jgi:hypothetical protein